MRKHLCKPQRELPEELECTAGSTRTQISLTYLAVRAPFGRRQCHITLPRTRTRACWRHHPQTGQVGSETTLQEGGTETELAVGSKVKETDTHVEAEVLLKTEKATCKIMARTHGALLRRFRQKDGQSDEDSPS
jgi:hypothetical protein